MDQLPRVIVFETIAYNIQQDLKVVLCAWYYISSTVECWLLLLHSTIRPVSYKGAVFQHNEYQTRHHYKCLLPGSNF